MFCKMFCEQLNLAVFFLCGFSLSLETDSFYTSRLFSKKKCLHFSYYVLCHSFALKCTTVENKRHICNIHQQRYYDSYQKCDEISVSFDFFIMFSFRKFHHKAFLKGFPTPYLKEKTHLYLQKATSEWGKTPFLLLLRNVRTNSSTWYQVNSYILNSVSVVFF